jgi:hypothetical protein
MVRHIVAWKLKEENREANIERMQRELTALVGKIEGLVSLEVGACFEGGEYSAALDSVFESREALDYYRTHPEHVKVADFIHTIALARTAIDYEI